MSRQEDITPKLQDIVQTTMVLMSLEYHAYSSAYRTAASSESYLRNKRDQQRSKFVTSSVADSSDPSSSLVYSPVGGGEFVTVKPIDRSRVPYTVSIPARVVRDSMESEYTLRSFHDNPCEMEFTARHPGTTMDSDVEDGEDIEEKYPHYQPTDTNSPITTTAAEQLFCIAFAGPSGTKMSELRASYPLQLSARIDESRKYFIFDCFEYKPRCFDLDDVDLTPYLPSNRGCDRWQQAFMPQDIKNDEDYYEDDDDNSYYDDQVEFENGPIPRGVQKYLIHNGLAGDFAYSRCLRFRFPLNNIVGIRLQAGSSKGSDSDDDVGAALILEVSCPAPKDAFAARKVNSRWFKDNGFTLTKDWTPNSAASTATRIYLYGGISELKQTAALLAKKCPAVALMLSSKSCESNTLRDGSSIDYSASPDFTVSEGVSYGDNGSTHVRTYEELNYEDRMKLRGDHRNALCRYCGEVYFRGNTGFPCNNCGDGRATKNTGPTSPLAFDGKIENALNLFEAKCKRLDAEKRGTDLKKMVLGK